MNPKELIGKQVAVKNRKNKFATGKLGYSRDGYYEVAGLWFEPDQVVRVAKGNPPIIMLED